MTPTTMLARIGLFATPRAFLRLHGSGASSPISRIPGLALSGLATLSVLAGAVALTAAPALAAPQAPVSEAATGVTVSAATLHGELNPVGEAETGWHFLYSTEPTCAGGTETSAHGVAKVKAKTKEEVQVTGLQPSKTYSFCLVATNAAAESTEGNSVSFTTAGVIPALAGERATFGSGPLDGTLEAKINPENQETTYHFEYATSEVALGTLAATKIGEAIIPPDIFEEQTAGPVDIGGGLEANKTYYYRVVASNATGTTEGPVRHFTTLNQEAPVTMQATSITGTTAVLNGELNPNSEGTAGYEFSYNAGGSCAGGATTPPGEATGKAIKVSATPRLESNTEYTFCLIATSATETTETLSGGPSTFFTLAIAPEVLEGSESSEGVTPFAATLKAEINPENQPATSCAFEYGKVLSEHSATCAPSSVEGSSPQTVTASLTGLEAATTYHYRLATGNATGKATGVKEESFTTPAAKAPVVENVHASSVTPFAATLNAEVNPEYQKTSCEFEYGKVVSEHKAKCAPPSLEGSGNHTVSLPVTGLEPGATYHFRVTAENATGNNALAEAEFTAETAKAPTVENVRASSVTPFAATLEGEVNPEYQKTSCEFEYGKVVSEHKAKCVPSSLEGSGNQTVSLPVTGLEPGATYHFRVAAENATGKNALAEAEFTAETTKAPTVENVHASSVTPFAATLEGEVNPEYQKTSCEFEYGKVLSEHKAKCAPPSLEGSGNQTVSLPLAGLEPGAIYHFRVVAENATGKNALAEAEFTAETAKAPVVENEKTSESSPVTAIHAQLQAEVNPDYQATSVIFEYSSNEAAVRESNGERIFGGNIAAGIGGAQPVSADLGQALQPNTIYYYRVVAENEQSIKEGKPADGKLQSFRTLIAPVLTTAAAQNVTVDSATLSGTVDPEGAEKTSYHYAYIDQKRYEEAVALGGALREIDPTFNPYAGGVSTPEVEVGNSDRTPLPAQPDTITGLASATTYHYALVAVATNAPGPPAITTTVISQGATFTTPTTPPTLGPTSVSNITQNTATITGSVQPSGLPTRWELQLGTNPGSLQFQASGHSESSEAQPLTLNLGPLAPGTTYYYKLTAINPDGTVETPEATFTTIAAPTSPPLTGTPLITLPNTTPPNEEKRNGAKPAANALTNAQKLSKALKVCHTKHGKRRAHCEAAAHKKYANKKRK